MADPTNPKANWPDPDSERAQPGDVLGIERGGETTSLGDTEEEEDPRRKAPWTRLRKIRNSRIPGPPASLAFGIARPERRVGAEAHPRLQIQPAYRHRCNLGGLEQVLDDLLQHHTLARVLLLRGRAIAQL